MAGKNGLFWLDFGSMSRQVFPAGTKDAPGRMRQHGNYILRDSACDHIITCGGDIPAQKHAAKRFLEAYELMNKPDRTWEENERLLRGERVRDEKGRFTKTRRMPLINELPVGYRKPMRANGRWNYKIMHALQRDFSREANIKATRAFCRSVTMGGKGVAIAAMHDLDTHNPHVHIMFFDRDTETGKSVQLLSEKPAIREKKGLEPNATVYVRKLWEMDCNATAAEFGYEVRIDHRSNAARGLEKGDEHRGWAVNALEEERDQETIKLERAKRSEIVVTTPEPETTMEAGGDVGHFLDWVEAKPSAVPPETELSDEIGQLPQSAPTLEIEPEPFEEQESSVCPEMEMAELPREVGNDGVEYFRDDRLREWRNVGDPHDRVRFDDVESVFVFGDLEKLDVAAENLLERGKASEPEMVGEQNPEEAQAVRDAEEDARADAEPEGEGWISGGRPPKTVAERVVSAVGFNERLDRIQGAEQDLRMVSFDIGEANKATPHKSHALQAAKLLEDQAAEDARVADTTLQRASTPYGEAPGVRLPNSRLIPKAWRGVASPDRLKHDEATRIDQEKKAAYAVAKGKTVSAINAMAEHQRHIERLELRRAEQILAAEKTFGKEQQRAAEKDMLKAQRDAVMRGKVGPHDLGPIITAEMIYESFKLGDLDGKSAIDALTWLKDPYFINVIQREIEKSLKRGPLLEV